MKMINVLPKNKQTGLIHTALLPTFVSALCFLLVKFGIVSSDKLDGETVSAIIAVVGIGIIMWRQWFKGGKIAKKIRRSVFRRWL